MSRGHPKLKGIHATLRATRHVHAKSTTPKMFMHGSQSDAYMCWSHIHGGMRAKTQHTACSACVSREENGHLTRYNRKCCLFGGSHAHNAKCCTTYVISSPRTVRRRFNRHHGYTARRLGIGREGEDAAGAWETRLPPPAAVVRSVARFIHMLLYTFRCRTQDTSSGAYNIINNDDDRITIHQRFATARSPRPPAFCQRPRYSLVCFIYALPDGVHAARC